MRKVHASTGCDACSVCAGDPLKLGLGIQVTAVEEAKSKDKL